MQKKKGFNRLCLAIEPFCCVVSFIKIAVRPNLDAVSEARKGVDVVEREGHHRKASVESWLEAHIELCGHTKALVEEVVEAYPYTHIQLVEVIRQVEVNEVSWR